MGKDLWTQSDRGDPVKIFEAYNNDEESLGIWIDNPTFFWIAISGPRSSFKGFFK